MSNFKDLVQQRRSHRKFTTDEIDAEDVKLILRAALMSPTSKGQRAWQFVVVDNPADIEKLADAKDLGSQFLKGAPLAIVVLGDTLRSDVWIEDASIVMTYMQLQAVDLGIGSCWVQCRLRSGATATCEENVRNLLHIPEHYAVEAILSLGIPAKVPDPSGEPELTKPPIHREKF